MVVIGEGYMIFFVLLFGLESEDVEIVDIGYVLIRFDEIRDIKKLFFGKFFLS